MASTFVVGEKFSCYQSLEDKVNLYQKTNSVQFYRRSSRTIEATKNRCPKKQFNVDLRFSELVLSCIHGGQNFKKRGEGKRHQSTFRMGCNAEIRLNTTPDGQFLEVKYVNEQHNHEQNQTVFRTLFHQRRLKEHDKENIANLLSVKANNKMIQQQLMSETGKCVLLKDIHNIRTKLKSSNNDLTTIQAAVEHLSKCNGAYVKLLTNEHNELRGLFFQDTRMREIFEAYPEFICIDATYKVNDLRMPLYILLIENGNGQSEIVGMWLVADETEDMITQMIQLFKDQNPNWDKIQTVMSDKDFVEREVFRKEIPQAKLRICLFHVLKTFRREMTMDKLKANRQQRDNILDILQKIAYSSSEQDYETNKSLLLETQNTQATEYFLQAWDPIKDQWVVGLATASSLGNRTNNRVESINQKLKQVVDKNAKFDDFAQDIVVFLNNHRTEIIGKMSKVTSKVPVVSINDDPVAMEYRKVLTDYAFTLLEYQLNKQDTVEIETNDDGTFIEKNTQTVITESTCACAFHRQYDLPCKHIFALRKTMDMNLFEKSLINERWSKHHFLGSFSDYQHVDQLHVSHSVQSPRGSIKSQQQRYRATFHVAQKLSSCAAEQTGVMFDIRLQQLETLLNSWERGDEVAIEIITAEGDNQLNRTTDTRLNDLPVNENDQTLPIHQNSDESMNEVNEIGTDSEQPSTSSASTSNTDEFRASAEIIDIVLPPQIKRRGRPKGSELTVIGLPKKRLKLKRRPTPFQDLKQIDRDRIMLKWFVDGDVAEHCLGSTDDLISENKVEARPELLNMAATETSLDSIEKYFQQDAWVMVLGIVECAKTRSVKCFVCEGDLETRCVSCDLCLSWFHYHCAAISDTPKTKFWFCRGCSG